MNGTIIAETPINTNIFTQSYSEDHSVPQFNLTEDILNELLQNVTISFMNTFTVWNTTVKADISTTRQVYAFSKPVNFFVPYALTLILALPFLVVGTLSLAKKRSQCRVGQLYPDSGDCSWQ